MAFQPGLKIKRMKKGILKGLELEKFFISCTRRKSSNLLRLDKNQHQR
jgi:hypothetical protein